MSRGRRAKGRPDDEGVSLGARSPEDDGHLGTQVWAIAPLLFGSGFCALVYQIGWQRELRLVFGASTAASAAVVAVFMGGLGLGGWLIGPRADRSPNPLLFYGPDLLKARADCYQQTGDPRAKRAAADLQEFLEADRSAPPP